MPIQRPAPSPGPSTLARPVPLRTGLARADLARTGLARTVLSRTVFVGSLLGIGAFLSACGAPANLPEDVLFREASLALEDESYATAIASYKKLLEEFPFSDRAEVASLNIAYAQYLKKEYGLAIGAFNDFERLYPVSPLLPFVGYTIGLCWLDQAKAGDRDPTFSKEALRQFGKIANEYPGTLYADLSVFRQSQARENLAAHELVIGDYYEKRKNLTAAADRYSYAMKEYPTTENAVRAASKLALVELAIAGNPGGSTKAVAKESQGPAPDANQNDPIIADDGDLAADIGVIDVDPVDVDIP